MNYINKTSDYLKKQFISKKLKADAKKVCEQMYSFNLNNHEKLAIANNYISTVRDNVESGLLSLSDPLFDSFEMKSILKSSKFYSDKIKNVSDSLIDKSNFAKEVGGQSKLSDIYANSAQASSDIYTGTNESTIRVDNSIVKRIDNLGNKIINSKEFSGNLISKYEACNGYFDYVSKLIEKSNGVTKVEITSLSSFKLISRRYNEIMNVISKIRDKITYFEAESYKHADGQKVRDLIEQVNTILNSNFNVVDKDNIILDGVVTDAPKKR